MSSPYQVKPCRRCGKPFQPLGANSRWCSDECCRGTNTCEECGRAFVPTRKSRGKFCSPTCWEQNMYPIGARAVIPQSGYVVIKVPRGTPGTITHGGTRDRWMFEHRFVMQQRLGRVLEPHETVHHKDGNKANNADGNLELWAGRHGKGVRASDYHCPGCRCFEVSHARQAGDGT